jgi:hypothetical protein
MLNTPAVIDLDPMAVTDKAFYVQLGQRLSAARKAQGLTQVQLAEALGIAPQRRRGLAATARPTARPQRR